YGGSAAPSPRSRPGRTRRGRRRRRTARGPIPRSPGRGCRGRSSGLLDESVAAGGRAHAIDLDPHLTRTLWRLAIPVGQHLADRAAHIPLLDRDDVERAEPAEPLAAGVVVRPHLADTDHRAVDVRDLGHECLGGLLGHGLSWGEGRTGGGGRGVWRRGAHRRSGILTTSPLVTARMNLADWPDRR